MCVCTCVFVFVCTSLCVCARAHACVCAHPALSPAVPLPTGRQASVPAQRHPAAWAEPDHGHAPHVHGSDASGSEQGQRPRPRGKEARRQYGMEGVEEGQEQVDEGGEVQGTPGVREVRPVVRCRPSAGKQQARKQQQQHMGQEQEAEEGRVVGFGGKAAVPAVAVAAPDEEQRPKRQRR